MRICVVAGSFDPLTLGHLDVIERASRIYDRVYACAFVNPDKQGTFPAEKRVEMMRKCTGHLENVICQADSGALLHYAKRVGACVIVRGLRNSEDFLYEYQWALTNRQLCPELEFVFFMTDPAYAHISSSHVRQLGSLGFDLSSFLPSSIVDEVAETLRGT